MDLLAVALPMLVGLSVSAIMMQASHRERRALEPPPPAPSCYVCGCQDARIDLVWPLKVCFADFFEIQRELTTALAPWDALVAVPAGRDPRWRPGPGLVEGRFPRDVAEHYNQRS